MQHLAGKRRLAVSLFRGRGSVFGATPLHRASGPSFQDERNRPSVLSPQSRPHPRRTSRWVSSTSSASSVFRDAEAESQSKEAGVTEDPRERGSEGAGGGEQKRQR